MLKPVIMAGGSGTRLWPLSRGNYPKQFLALAGNNSMLQQTLQRLEGLEHQAPLVICNEEHRFLAAEQIRQLGLKDSAIVLEPFGRNTAPAVALAAIQAMQADGDATLLVMAADHVFADVKALQEVINQAEQLAETGAMVTFGITPTQAETGYGYIQQGSAVSHGGFKVARFVEKPNAELAAEYLDAGDYLWNSGIFVFKASRYLEELQQYRPDIYQACQAAMQQQTPDLDFIRIDEAAFANCPSESIDYAVMEKTDAAVVIPLSAGWNDVGGFAALWQILDKDDNGNVCRGDVVCQSTRNSLIHSSDKLVATVGVEDLVIVNTKDAVLVAHKDQTQQVKNIVEALKAEDRSEVSFHREVYRPWGKYDSIDHGSRFQVKRITVKPGAKLSVQMHHHRAEHWIVVSGTAKVTINDTEQYLTENQSVYIPITAVHALENPGKVELELIEVQSGSYLGEDDIVRFEDRYGRA
ncbi:mannose-1-phosphate guanylyltransferase/mannose-6-phosphate isomerase [Alkalimonas delamerensis]|uniref:mannose-1-phosphate guanylyltransferase n=1 Tax=Alkalimonas delamerensis TaxID=265981 RepID=A0ABT9GME3_9GAMM|nr:mannose-1-phosphate guanylyltransferase/mannose-6-phosphate isomerase [Alkalimonas delamerensis]MDP4528139.1 mannose-1-phosphate guanylyltransferase/mannose-6-phosphate isomerase [Alkalimonas delamerensis]